MLIDLVYWLNIYWNFMQCLIKYIIVTFYYYLLKKQNIWTNIRLIPPVLYVKSNNVIFVCKYCCGLHNEIIRLLHSRSSIFIEMRRHYAGVQSRMITVGSNTEREQQSELFDLHFIIIHRCVYSRKFIIIKFNKHSIWLQVFMGYFSEMKALTSISEIFNVRVTKSDHKINQLWLIP